MLGAIYSVVQWHTQGERNIKASNILRPISGLVSNYNFAIILVLQ